MGALLTVLVGVASSLITCHVRMTAVYSLMCHMDICNTCRVVAGMGALLAIPAGRAGGWASGVRAPTAADGGITTSHALLGASGGAAGMQLSGLQVSLSHGLLLAGPHLYTDKVVLQCSLMIISGTNIHIAGSWCKKIPWCCNSHLHVPSKCV